MGDEISDEELEQVAARVRSVRRREMIAKSSGAAVAFILFSGIFGGTFLVVERQPGDVRNLGGRWQRGGWRIVLAMLGFAAGVFTYRSLSPKQSEHDVQ